MRGADSEYCPECGLHYDFCTCEDEEELEPEWGEGSVCPWCGLDWEQCQCDREKE